MPPYIIEGVQLCKNDTLKTCSLLIEKNRIQFIDHHLEKLKFMRMLANEYVMTPGFIMMDTLPEDIKTFPQVKSYLSENYLIRGCTSLISVIPIQYEGDIQKKVKERRQILINSPIDFYIALEISAKNLTPSLLRLCKKLKISMVIVNFFNENEIRRVPWGWIRDALFMNPVTLIPKISKAEMSFFQYHKVKFLWRDMVKEHKLTALQDCPQNNRPLQKNELMTIGIYPDKGDLRIGGQVDYNLYKLEDVGYSVEENIILDYHIHKPTFTVHKGRLQKAEKIHYYTGFGEECVIPITKRFLPQSATN
ncbi:hypothetical protein [Metabacillus arenae]|uniref:Uncharacterized protein n=1 Tax=Metabacillus arenae TaxID=2771434 RepID=A0A926S265_9BACI|nr:hypothetical protein [Metabacillus arenae]MBD1381694.1 hypothetical protein [Metabacillus arenae]